jgi:hypothetical protein
MDVGWMDVGWSQARRPGLEERESLSPHIWCPVFLS